MPSSVWNLPVILIKICKLHTLHILLHVLRKVSNLILQNFIYTFFYCLTISHKRKWVFATYSDFLIPITWQPILLNLSYFKLLILLDQIVLVWNIKGLHHQVAKLWGLENLSLLQKNQFLCIFSMKLNVYVCIELNATIRVSNWDCISKFKQKFKKSFQIKNSSSLLFNPRRRRTEF